MLGKTGDCRVCGILILNSMVLPSSKGYISQYTSLEVYGLIINEINEGIISIMILKNDILDPY